MLTPMTWPRPGSGRPTIVILYGCSLPVTGTDVSDVGLRELEQLASARETQPRQRYPCSRVEYDVVVLKSASSGRLHLHVSSRTIWVNQKVPSIWIDEAGLSFSFFRLFSSCDVKPRRIKEPPCLADLHLEPPRSHRAIITNYQYDYP